MINNHHNHKNQDHFLKYNLRHNKNLRQNYYRHINNFNREKKKLKNKGFKIIQFKLKIPLNNFNRKKKKLKNKGFKIIKFKLKIPINNFNRKMKKLKNKGYKIIQV